VADDTMVSMKISKSEREEKYAVPAEASEGPSYPYGLCLHLDDDVMKKLAMKTLPAVGKQVVVYALADVVSVSEHESLIGGSRQSVELQITDLAPLTAASGKKDAGDALYAKD
jgi:hypothetical protein